MVKKKKMQTRFVNWYDPNYLIIDHHCYFSLLTYNFWTLHFHSEHIYNFYHPTQNALDIRHAEIVNDYSIPPHPGFL